MKVSEAIDILERYNKWRCGADVKPIPCSSITLAIDLIIFDYKISKQINNAVTKTELFHHQKLN